MDLNLNPDEQRFRDEFRAWLEGERTRGMEGQHQR